MKMKGPWLAISLALASCGARAPDAGRRGDVPVVAPAPPAPKSAAPSPKADAPSASPREAHNEAHDEAQDEEHLVEETPEANPRSDTVTIKLVAEPARKARVFWGRKDLGFAPLELQRPRGSGPLDLLVIAPGALPLHTRVFTDRDDKLSLRLVPGSDASSMLGYRAP